MPTKFAIVGLQRTGTTWIRTTLDAHPSIQAAGEVFLYSHGRIPIWRTAGHEVSQSYGEYIESSIKRRLRHFTNRHAIVKEYLNHLFTTNDLQAIGFKLMRNQAKQFPTVVKYIQDQRLHVIHVVRENVLKTYISRETAKRRGLYHAENSVSVQQIALRTSDLVHQLNRIAKDNSEWERIFTKSPYLKVLYESFVKDKDNELERLYSFLSVDPDQSVASTLTKINPDSIQGIVENYSAVRRALEGTPYEWCLSG